ncbi:MAG: M6 family metalloprotease domain-containing protein [Paludibacteraceae bacterium]|nr:M6 family metalloprotease domain-containing protein [Paludibacteraceae bacterium]
MRRILSIVAILAVCLTMHASSNGGVRHLQPTRVPVILANYADVKFQNTDFNEYKESIEQYFADNSFGQYTPTFDFIGPVTLDNNYNYYGANDSDGDDVAAEEMVATACNKAENLADFTLYDQDGDGRLDAVVIIYAGQGERMDNNMPDAVWEFTDDLETTLALDYLVQLDGKTVASCCAVPELRAKNKRDGIGTLVHEFAHILGLPNFSTTNQSTVKTLGDWSVMDHGCYNDGANTPAAFSAYERFYLGWVEPILLDVPMSVRLRNLNTSGDCAIITASGQSNLSALSPAPTEFYMLENRQQNGWDMYLPGHGLMLTKIGYVKNKWESDEVNNIENHPCVDLVEADGSAPKYKADNLTNGYFGKQGDLFPSGATGYKMFSNKMEFSGVREQGGIILFDFNGGVDKCVVTFYVGAGGTCATPSLTETNKGAGVVLPAVTANANYTFKGWSTRKNSNIADAGQPGQTFYPMCDCSVYAVMQDNSKYWVHYEDYTGVTIDKYIGFNGAYVATGKIQDIGITFVKKTGYTTPTAANCMVKVECGGKQLNSYTFDHDTIRVSVPAAAIIGDIYITIVNAREQKENGCEAYSHTFTKACMIENKADLSGYDWKVTMANDKTDYDESKGAVFGSNSYPTGKVSLYTEETMGCAVAKVTINAAANGDGVLSVYYAGNQIGEAVELTSSLDSYDFTVEKPHTGALEIRLENKSKAMYLKSIEITYTKLEDPDMPSAIQEIEPDNQHTATRGRKIYRNGQLFILFNGHMYNVLGVKIK